MVLLIGRDQMGDGDRELGRKILGTFLRKSIAFPDLEAVALFNDGAKLAVKDSPIAIELTQLHDRGVEVIPCSTCVEHYGLTNDLLLPAGSMDDIIAAIRKSTRVVSL